VRYDPVERPEAMLVTAPILYPEPPDVVAARVRREVAAAIAGPLSARDVASVRLRFARWLGSADLAPDACAADPRALAVARARRAQLGVDGRALASALERVTQAQLDQAAALFSEVTTAAVVAGGTLR
jgi:hypothetical protein